MISNHAPERVWCLSSRAVAAATSGSAYMRSAGQLGGGGGGGLQSEGEESGGESGKEEREKEEERSGKDATPTPLLQPNAKPRRKSRQFFELSPSDAPFAAPTPTRDVGTQGDGGEDEIEERSVAQLLSAGRPPGGRRWHGPPAGGKGKGRGRVRGKGRGKGSKGKGKGMRGWGKDGEGRARNF